MLFRISFVEDSCLGRYSFVFRLVFRFSSFGVKRRYSCVGFLVVLLFGVLF